MLTLLTLVSGLLAFVLLIYAALALRRRRWGSLLFRLVLSLSLLLIGAAAGTVSVALQGYRSLIRETVAATVALEQLGPQRYRATVTYPDGSSQTFDLAGDALFVDAHILKWHPRATILGLTTMYELDRIAGRYNALDDERNAPRTVHELSQEKPMNMFNMVQRFEPLRALVDAEYGSATFVPAGDGERYAILVSTTGLLARELK